MVTEKSVLRKRFMALRRAIPANERETAQTQISRHIVTADWYLRADMLLCYAAFGSETDIMAVVRDAWKRGKIVCFPRCTDENGRMAFYRVEFEKQLTKGMYGIPEPEEGCVLQENFSTAAVCLIPGLAFDKKGCRLGYGKGYYDRFLAEFSGVRVGVCLHTLFQPDVTWEYDRYDIAAEYVVTEQGIQVCGEP